MLSSCRCGPRVRSENAFIAMRVVDAGRGRSSPASDPTGTLPLQRLFSRDLRARWATLRKMIPDAVAHTSHRISAIQIASLTGQDPIHAFQSWVDEALRQVVLGTNGAWTLNYVRQAGDRGSLRAAASAAPNAASAVPQMAALADRIPTLQSLAVAELQGICEAVSQQAVRAYAEGMLRRQTSPQIARNIQQAIETIGRKRGDLLVSFMVVRAFIAASLDAFRGKGVTHVGILPERLPRPPVITDAKFKKKSKVKNLVGVLTAGDDDVCPACEDIAEGAPYTLDEVEKLIPAHPRCRCSVYPWHDARFAGDAEWDEDKHPRDEHGRWTVGGGYDLTDPADHEALMDQTLSSPLYAREEEALNKYSENDYYDMNAALRAGLDADTKNIDSVFARASTPVDMVVYRQVDKATYDRAIAAGEYNDKAFVSATADRSRLSTNNVLTLQLPKGSRAIPIGHLSDHDATEAEVLIDRSQRFKIVKGSTARLIIDDATFDPDQHPRDAHGKFSAVGGLKSWTPPETDAEWASVPGQDHSINEPELPDLKQKSYSYVSKSTGELKTYQPPDLRLSSGVVMREPDGRVWLVKPTKGFGGYDHTFPKGGVEPGLHPQANAIKEVYEETGLKARITGFAGDYRGDTSITRMYHAVRETGHTKDKGWESEAVVLAHPHQVDKLLNRSRDKLIASHHVHDAVANVDAQTHIAAGVMFLDPQGKALFVRRSTKGDHSGEWCFPGGAVDAGETPQGAAAREALEEVGTAPLNMEQVDRRENNGVDFTTYASHVAFIFEPTLNGEHTEWVWRPLSDPPEPLHPGVRATIDAAVLGDEWSEADHPRHPKGHPDGGKFAKKGAEDWTKQDEVHESFTEQLHAAGIVHFKEEDYVVHVAQSKVPEVDKLAEQFGGGIIQKYHPQTGVTKYKVMPSSESGYTLVDPAAPTPLKMENLTKIAGKKGSNEGGVYAESGNSPHNQQYYIKTPKTLDHVDNELIAAALYKTAGVNTMEYVPVEGGAHVATLLQNLKKKNVNNFNADERHEAQKDFAIHAWLANHDAAGTGGDNQVIDQHGKVATVDTGGSMKYRAQGEPKGAVFGNEVTEFKTMRGLDPNVHAPDAAALYGNMTNDQLLDSMSRVVDIDNQAISTAVHGAAKHMTPAEKSALVDKLIARKQSVINQMNKIAEVEGYGKAKPTAFDPEPTPDPTAPKTFKTKTEHIKHLLLEGTTSENLKAKMGWKAVSMPQQAAATGLKLEITKKNGVNFYKGTPIDPKEAAAVAAAKVVPIKAPAVVVTKAPAHPGVVSTKHDITTPAGNFKQTLEEHGVKYDTQESHVGQFVTLSDPKDVQKVLEIHKWHPKVEKLSVNEYFVAAPDAQAKVEAIVKSVTAPTPVSTPKFDPPTDAELQKAKKSTKLTAQYVPGAPAGHPQAEALIAGFNAKYEGKGDLTPEQLAEKVNAFKQLTESMKPLQSEAQKLQVAKNAEAKVKAAQAEAAAKANMYPTFATEAEEEMHWYNKAIGDSHYLSNAQQVVNSAVKGKKLAKMGMTVPEVAFIKAFTGSHSGVNQNLIKGTMSVEELAYKQIMNGALDKMEPHDGSQVYRKIVLTPEQQADYVVGKVKQWTNFSSTSKNPDTWSGNTHFTIKNPKTGVDVEFISSNPHEAEVIMPADTHYLVLSKTPNQNVHGKSDHGTMHIVLEEVVFGKAKKKKVA